MSKSKNAGNERVAVSLPRGTKYAQFVSVNGVGYNIPARGTHEVPPEIAAELERAFAAEDAMNANSEALRNASTASYQAAMAKVSRD